MISIRKHIVSVCGLFLGAVLLGLSLDTPVAATERPTPQTASDLFQLTNIWTIYLKFTPERWEAMEPKGSPGGPFGGPFFERRNAGGRPNGPGGFGPAQFIVPAFFRQGDENHDGKLSGEEFQALAQKWFAQWDKTKSGSLDGEQVREGLNSTIAGPGGPGMRGPGMNLQGPEGKRNGLASAMGIEFEYVHADMEFEGKWFKDVAVRYKGNGTFLQSRGSLKRSLKVELNKYVKGRNLAGVTRLNLHNCVTDASWMNEVLAFKLYRDAGVPAPRTAYARVYVTVPGEYQQQYFGLYSLVEDVDRNFIQQNLATKNGALFKPVTPELFADLGDDWARYKQTYDPKSKLSPDQTQRLIQLCRLVTSADDAEFSAKLGDYVDLDEFARFMAVMVYLSDMDGILGPGQNFYLFLEPKTRKFRFIPWDQDHSFGQFGMRGSQQQRENLSLLKPWEGPRRFLERVFQLESFRRVYLAHMASFSQTLFQPARFQEQVDQLATVLRPGVKAESGDKLARFDQAVAGEQVEAPGFGGFRDRPPGATSREEPRPGGGADGGPGFGPPRGFFQPTKPIKPFVLARSQSVADQLAGRSAGETLGDFGFGGRGGMRGPGPGRFGPGMFLGPAFMEKLDANKDGRLTLDEMRDGFDKWHRAWDTEKSGVLTEEQLRAGIEKDLLPFRAGPPGGFGFGPPGGPPPDR